MSGLSGGGIAPRPIDGGADYCMNLVIKTNLSSVNEEVLNEVVKGETLPVVAEGIEGPVRVLKNGMILARRSNPQIASATTTRSWALPAPA